MLWILGDVVGLPFLLTLFARFRAEQQHLAQTIDAQLDAHLPDPDTTPPDSPASGDVVDDTAQAGLWWENDPQLRQRFQH
ncbi:hypothetical protein [Williamsia sp. CHRR-6]|uniref:hypothetical protein n=1 Tax=Williamsia sp. CHRR-6 TaxID=2835871 RepID=UPI001BDB63A9|nr:hypothetical protein [Williamsia sp. CHRR-6]MBT0566970.1 hypothetical protein [Williamsia sp. CHRR-6]